MSAKSTPSNDGTDGQRAPRHGLGVFLNWVGENDLLTETQPIDDELAELYTEWLTRGCPLPHEQSNLRSFNGGRAE